jgi:hypothetical protein
VLFAPEAGFTGTTVPVTYQVLDRDGQLHASTMRVHVSAAGSAAARGHHTGLRPGFTVASGGLKPGAVVNGVSEKALPDTGAPMSPVLPLSGLFLVVAGAVLVRRPARRPLPRHRAG